jgi:hypothetical protein
MKKLLIISLLAFASCTKVCVKENTPERLQELQHRADSTGLIVRICLTDENCYQLMYEFRPKDKPVNISEAWTE